ncbi:MAG: polysaccharide deacetylase family protein [Planctomycetes bacterium]|nr:polysaccharide deacetylase family protein [Planctomycetota bacterium]
MARSGICFASHTLTHPHLTSCTDSKLRQEVEDSKKIIEDELGRRIEHFCYPYGDYDERVIHAVRRAGYRTACTTNRGAVVKGTSPFELPRLTVGKRMHMQRFLLRVMIRH